METKTTTPIRCTASAAETLLSYMPGFLRIWIESYVAFVSISYYVIMPALNMIFFNVELVCSIKLAYSK
jgi:hypothetical protein